MNLMEIPFRYNRRLEQVEINHGIANALLHVGEFLDGCIPARYVWIEKPSESQGYAMRRIDATLPDKGLVFVGPTGTRKSTLAGATLRALEAKSTPDFNFTFAWVTWAQLCKLVGGFRYDAAVELVYRASVLVIDELGQFSYGESVMGQVQDCIERRYAHGLPFIATSNQGDAELREKLGAATFSRMWDMARVVEINDSRNWRLPNV